MKSWRKLKEVFRSDCGPISMSSAWTVSRARLGRASRCCCERGRASTGSCRGTRWKAEETKGNKIEERGHEAQRNEERAARSHARKTAQRNSTRAGKSGVKGGHRSAVEEGKEEGFCRPSEEDEDQTLQWGSKALDCCSHRAIASSLSGGLIEAQLTSSWNSSRGSGVSGVCPLPVRLGTDGLWKDSASPDFPFSPVSLVMLRVSCATDRALVGLSAGQSPQEGQSVNRLKDSGL